MWSGVKDGRIIRVLRKCGFHHILQHGHHHVLPVQSAQGTPHSGTNSEFDDELNLINQIQPIL